MTRTPYKPDWTPQQTENLKLRLIREWDNLTQNEKLEMAHQLAWRKHPERDWQSLAFDPLPMPHILGDAPDDTQDDEPSGPPIWWKLIGAAVLVASSGLLYYGFPTVATELAQAVPNIDLATARNVIIGVKWGVMVSAGPVLWYFMNA